MGFSAAVTRLGPPLMLFWLGAAAMFAARHGLFANLALAVMLAVWTLAAIVARARRDARTQAAPSSLAPYLAEQAREQRRLTAYLNLSPAPLVTLDGEGRLHAVNRAARRLFGYEDLMPDPPAGLVEAIADAAPGRSASVRLDLADGTRAFALATADLAAGATGTRIAALVDIDAELRVAEAGALRDLLQVLSHEIMNALTPISSLGQTAADMLADLPDPRIDAARDAIETVVRRADGLQRFTRSYRDLARLPPPEIRALDLRGFFADLERMAAARWPALALATDLDRAPRAIHADPDQLNAALWALLQNAAEAVADTPGGAITLRCEPVVEGIAIGVSDNGAGIAETARETIFQPFFTTKASGNGIGLALVRQIAHAHRGTVTLLDSPGGGAHFELYLPNI